MLMSVFSIRNSAGGESETDVGASNCRDDRNARAPPHSARPGISPRHLYGAQFYGQVACYDFED